MRFRQLAVRVLVLGLWLWGIVPIAVGTVQASNLFGEHGPGVLKIDIKPNDADNIVRASSGRVVSVAIFGSADFDVITINPRTIRLNGVNVMLVGKSDKSLCSRPADIDGDNYDDLVCDIRTTGFKVGEGEYKIILKAATYHGESLKGEDRIRVVLN